jgi:hypothetical protein
MAQQPGYSPPGWSADGNWFWDGLAWNDAVSPDGKWRFDGSDWKAFAGERTTKPATPPLPASAEPPPLMAAPAPDMPSWVAPSEIDRLDNERRELAARAAAPEMPLPPELDWHNVGAHMKFSRPMGAFSMDVAGLGIYILLSLFCWPAGLVYLWRANWGCGAKLAAIVLWLAVSITLVLALRAAGVYQIR